MNIFQDFMVENILKLSKHLLPQPDMSGIFVKCQGSNCISNTKFHLKSVTDLDII